MLDLQTRIHLEEIEIARRGREQKLNCAGANIVHSLRDLDCGFAHAGTQPGVINWRGALFNNFLMAALDGTLAFTKMNIIAVLVGKDLDFYVSRLLNYLFQIDF